MMTTSSYEFGGRAKQKARTRAALVAAARELLTEGADQTIEAVASRAGIAASTAYRYFPNRRSLLLACYPDLGTASLLGDDPPTDPVGRLEIVTAEIGKQLLEYEGELRAALRISLEPARGSDPPALRRGRALKWIEEALGPLKGAMGPAELHRLALSIRAAIGIEPLIWLTDVGGLSSEEAVAAMQTSARTLLKASLPATWTP